MSIKVIEYQPSPDLVPYIAFFWSGKFNLNSFGLLSQLVVPNGFVELIIHLSDLHCELLDTSSFSKSPDFTAIGLYSRPYQVNFKGTVDVFGIRFKPEGLHQIFGVPASELSEDYTDLENIAFKKLRDHFKQIREHNNINEMISSTETIFRNQLNGNKINLYYLNNAAEIIRNTEGNITVNELSGKVFISKRQLEREFKEKIGISPKNYIRIARLNKVNRAIQSGSRIDFSDISYQSGYSDQAHFIRDFKNFTGESPKLFLNNVDKFIINPNSRELEKGAEEISL